MKIWLDLRFINDDLYSDFVIELTKSIITHQISKKFIIYTNQNLKWFDFSNCIIKKVLIKNNSIQEQIKFNKILKKDNNALIIFFNHCKPIFYKWYYIILISTLKDIYYNNFSNYFHKYIFLYLLEKNLKKANKIICFDKNTNNELIEKFNIKEQKINLINWFFPNKNLLTSIENLKINIRIKYDLKNNYFIYSWWEWVEKNYEKLINVFYKLKKEWVNIDLVILGRNISKNIPLRKLILKLNMQKNIHFISVIKQNERILLYKNSLWVLFPSFYEPFPFRLTEPLYYNTKIIASDLINIKEIFWNTITYFSPISVNNIYEIVKNNITLKNKKIDYNEIINKYTTQKTTEQIINIIN
jgi:glycosyltransferase involved in cell wall biosynthesis